MATTTNNQPVSPGGGPFRGPGRSRRNRLDRVEPAGHPGCRTVTPARCASRWSRPPIPPTTGSPTRFRTRFAPVRRHGDHPPRRLPALSGRGPCRPAPPCRSSLRRGPVWPAPTSPCSSLRPVPRPLYFDETVDIGVVVGDLTRTTFQVGYLLQVDGEIRSTAVSVHGAVTPRWQAGKDAGVAGRGDESGHLVPGRGSPCRCPMGCPPTESTGRTSSCRRGPWVSWPAPPKPPASPPSTPPTTPSPATPGWPTGATTPSTRWWRCPLPPRPPRRSVSTPTCTSWPVESVHCRQGNRLPRRFERRSSHPGYRHRLSGARSSRPSAPRLMIATNAPI